ncbi:hypothetical protein OH807_00690 [Kitasatospora sp. NBC_01560]|uniref:hypothetical protein n=1 Tax=Kitasatospora sp. NBC_01560 TaxID=2975965 RepID=UPI003870A02E
MPAAPTTPAQGFADLLHTVLTDLPTRSLLLLAAFTTLAALFAWWAAHHSLRRLHRVTTAAWLISTGSALDKRLGLTGRGGSQNGGHHHHRPQTRTGRRRPRPTAPDR